MFDFSVTTIRIKQGQSNVFDLVYDEQGNLIENVLAHRLGRDEEFLSIFCVENASFLEEQTQNLIVNGVEFPIETVEINYA